MGSQLRFEFGQAVEPWTAEGLSRFFGERLKERVTVIVHDNRKTMVSASFRGDTRKVRLHHMFLDADQPVLDAVAGFIKTRSQRCSKVLGDYIEQNETRIRQPETRKRQPPKTLGAHHDLSDMYRTLNDTWFAGKADAEIGWGRYAPRRRKRGRTYSIRLGTYCETDKRIRIHPVLDQAWVPAFFVRYVVFHEMLHHMVPAPVKKGRKRFHSPEFTALERRYPDYERVLAWEKAHLTRLLRTRRG